MSEPLLPRVKRTIDFHHLLEKDDRLIVGVSGGVDSMVLLYVLHAFRESFHLDLIVGHVNHGFRPEESEKEAELVRKESERLGLPFEYAQLDVKAFQKVKGLSPQDAARRMRFHFFDDLVKKHHARKIALGQNADDQVETLLLRLMRGSGLRGLKGILPFRGGTVIRPLLEVWRKEIDSFAASHDIPYLVDSSNRRVEYLRNRVRLNLIPSIERDFQPNFKGIILKTAAILQDEDDYLERGAEEACQKIVCDGHDGLSFRHSEFLSLHRAIQWRVVQKLLKRMIPSDGPAEESEWTDLRLLYQKLIHPSASFNLELSFGLSVEKRYDQVFLRKGKGVPPLTLSFEVELAVPGRTYVEAIGQGFVSEEISRNEETRPIFVGTSRDMALLDSDRLQFPLKVRNFRPGDRFQPLGVKGTQKLKEFFIDHKIPRFERPDIPLLAAGESIVWVVGYRIDERFKVTETTRRILKVRVETVSSR